MVLVVIVVIAMGIVLSAAAGLGGSHEGSAHGSALGDGDRYSGNSGNAVHLKEIIDDYGNFVAARAITLLLKASSICRTSCAQYKDTKAQLHISLTHINLHNANFERWETPIV